MLYVYNLHIYLYMKYLRKWKRIRRYKTIKRDKWKYAFTRINEYYIHLFDKEMKLDPWGYRPPKISKRTYKYLKCPLPQLNFYEFLRNKWWGSFWKIDDDKKTLKRLRNPTPYISIEDVKKLEKLERDSFMY